VEGEARKSWTIRAHTLSLSDTAEQTHTRTSTAYIVTGSQSRKSGEDPVLETEDVKRTTGRVRVLVEVIAEEVF
jgi:hypothetical protein